ncbi:hypothetical protein [Candidatus Methylobacter oryzae]|uniref:hypothetical protein n=1 Tax=Candidatus Methylobacter oryzae TaxID=2497749 RepID=UPI001F5015C8|nr:hypothetical protein [Candidatus Methylobacter oryzae]
MVDAIVRQDNPALWAEFRRLSDTLSDGADLVLRLDFNICYHHATHHEALPALERILAWAEQAELDDSDRIILAEYLLNIRDDADGARQYVEGVEQPSTYRWSGGSQWKNLAPFVQRIRLNRLMVTLGIEIDLVAAVPEAQDPKERGNVLFERHLVIIASLWGKAKRRRLSGSEIVHTLHSALRLYQRRHKETRDWRAWYEIESAANDYFDFLIRAVAAHGEEGVGKLNPFNPAFGFCRLDRGNEPFERETFSNSRKSRQESVC